MIKPVCTPMNAAGQRKCVDCVVLDHEELELLLDVGGIRDQPIAERVDVVGHFGIVEVLRAGANLPHDLLTQLSLLL